MSLLSEAIGGYFELELPKGKGEMYSDALKYQSARAAFMALLQQMPNITRVWAPNYICDSMLAPIHAAGKKLEFYSVNKKLCINESLKLNHDDLLLYVNYFGVCDSNIAEILESHNPNQVVIDCSQAFYSGPYDCQATIYSPRKFFGVPDGGLLFTRQALAFPKEQDCESASRMEHLIKRLAFSAEAGYAHYKNAEESLNDLIPKSMSELTLRLLKSIDYLRVKEVRQRNFQALHQALEQSNSLTLSHEIDAPMCYPYLPFKPLNKSSLAEHRIFIPTYWPDVFKRTNLDDFAMMAANNLLAIPCDQRYEIQDIDRITKELSHALFP